MLENKEGLKIPHIEFPVRDNNEWVTWNTQSLFGNKRVVLFALPGAFTPTCSSAHLPRYNELAPMFKQLGIADVICLSVNDTFVMNAWKDDQKAEHIRFLPDGNGAFSKALGMLVDKANLGFGARSWRYSAVIDDGVVEKMFIEADQPGDPFAVSDADTMLHYLDPKATVPPSITVFSKVGCGHCTRAKALLDAKKLVFNEIIVNEAIPVSALRGLSGNLTTPQVFINGELIGGADQLEEYFK